MSSTTSRSRGRIHKCVTWVISVARAGAQTNLLAAELWYADCGQQNEPKQFSRIEHAMMRAVDHLLETRIWFYTAILGYQVLRKTEP